MNGKIFEVGTDVSEIQPQPSSEEIQEIVFAAFTEAMTLPDKKRAEVGRYLADLSKGLLDKEGK